MAKKVLSIVIGTECTKVCEVSYKKDYKNKGIRVYRSISFPTPPNTIEDGYIRDKNAFGEELKSRLKAAKFKSDKVIFSVASSKIANREVILPLVNEKKIMDIIKTGASEYFPIDLKEYILSYMVLEKKTSARKEKKIKKKISKKDLKLAKKLAKQNKKALKKKSKTDLIADNMELMEAKERELPQENDNNETKSSEANSGKRQMRLSVFAVPSTLVKNYYNFASAMHFDIVAIDYSGNSSYQIIKRQANRGTNVFVQLNEQDTLISILRDDILILQRTVGYGISNLTGTVIEQVLYHISNEEEALELLKNRNLLTLEQESSEPIQFDSSWSQGEVAAASEYIRVTGETNPRESNTDLDSRRNIRDSLHFLTNSIARMLDYYKSNHKEIEIDTVYLTGIGIRVQGIESFFSSEIGFTLKKMEKLWTVSSKKKAAAYRNNPSEFISCIGAVIKPIDFVPVEFIIKKQKRSAVIATIIFVLACIAGSVGTVYVSYTDYQTASKELIEVNRLNDAMPPISSTFSEYDKAVKELENLQQLEAMTQSKNDNIKEVIGELEKKLPSNTIITNLQFTETGIIMNVTANDINSIGSNAIISKLILQLKAIQYFQNVESSGISVVEENGVSVVSVTITCTYVP